MITNNLYFIFAQADTSSEVLNPSFSQTLFHSNLINFLIVVILVSWIVRKTKLISYISDKRNAIINSIKHSEEENVKADTELKLSRKQVSKSDKEVRNILDDASNIAGNIAERILQEADMEAVDLVKR